MLVSSTQQSQSMAQGRKTRPRAEAAEGESLVLDIRAPRSHASSWVWQSAIVACWYRMSLRSARSWIPRSGNRQPTTWATISNLCVQTRMWLFSRVEQPGSIARPTAIGRNPRVEIALLRRTSLLRVKGWHLSSQVGSMVAIRALRRDGCPAQMCLTTPACGCEGRAIMTRCRQGRSGRAEQQMRVGRR